MDEKYRGRKFGLAAFAMAVSAIALLAGIIDGNAWYLSIAIILGMYGAANITEKKNASNS